MNNNKKERKSQLKAKRKKKKNRKDHRFEDFGTVAGSLFGPVGAVIGNAGGALIDSFTGHGDYTVKRNSLWKNGKMRRLNIDNNDRTFSHYEQVADYVVDSSSDDQIHSILLNPLNPQFAILNKMASLYQEYRPLGIVLQVLSTESPYAGAAPDLGVYAMGVNYDPEGSPPADYLGITQMSNSKISNGTSNLVFPIECSPSQSAVSKFYVSLNGEEPRLESQAVVYWTTQNMVVGARLQIFATYHYDFSKFRTQEEPASGIITAKICPTVPITSSNDYFNGGYSASGLNSHSIEIPSNKGIYDEVWLKVKGTYTIHIMAIGTGLAANAFGSFTLGPRVAKTSMYFPYDSATNGVKTGNSATTVASCIINVVAVPRHGVKDGHAVITLPTISATTVTEICVYVLQTKSGVASSEGSGREIKKRVAEISQFSSAELKECSELHGWKVFKHLMTADPDVPNTRLLRSAEKVVEDLNLTRRMNALSLQGSDDAVSTNGDWHHPVTEEHSLEQFRLHLMREKSLL